MEYKEKSCIEFAELLASKSAVPGGGGASALAGALGVALGNMVGSLTIGKKKYANVEEEIISLNEKAEILRKDLLEMVEKDAEVFEPLSKAYSIPKDDHQRDEVMVRVLKEAAEIPLIIMRKCCDALELISVYEEKGSALAISDAGCGAALCGAALKSAALNVFINTKAMKDRKLAESMNKEVVDMLVYYDSMAVQIYESVSRRLK